MKIKTLATNLLLLALLSGCGKPTPPSASKSAPPAISIQDAARTGNLEAIQQHIQATSNLNEKAPDSGGSPLHTAAVFGQLEAVRALVQAGADVNARNNDGSTPSWSPRSSAAPKSCNTCWLMALTRAPKTMQEKRHSMSSRSPSIKSKVSTISLRRFLLQ